MSTYIYTVLKLFWPFEDNRKADMAPGENEFDSPALYYPCNFSVNPKLF